MRHDTVVSRRRRSHATAALSDFFCVPFGGRANRRVSTPPTRPLQRRSPSRARRMHLRLRVERRLRPTCVPAAAPDGDLHQGLHDRNALVRLGRRWRQRRPWRPGARHRLRRMRNALPASSAHLRGDAEDNARGFAGCATGLPTTATTAAPAQSSDRPRADGTWTIVTCGFVIVWSIMSCTCVMSESRELKCLKCGV